MIILGQLRCYCLKKFETQAAYEAAQSGLILPNVSLTVDNNTVHYNPSTPVPPTPSHDYVEIGGIKWATMNVGASSVTDYGLYFQWGDTQGYTVEQAYARTFDFETYKYGGDEDGGQTKYNDTDEKTVLDASDDAVTAAWGGNWRMPTVAEYQTLGNAVNSIWTNDYQGSGIGGVICTDKTDSSKVLFFPAAGIEGDLSSESNYWSSSLSFGAWAYYISLEDGDFNWNDENLRKFGYPIRGILDE